jgi:hypothetical protein
MELTAMDGFVQHTLAFLPTSMLGPVLAEVRHWTILLFPGMDSDGDWVVELVSQ